MALESTVSEARPFSGRSGFFATLVVSVGFAILFQSGRLHGTTESGATLRFDQVIPAGDALHFAERWEAARVALLSFHQFPSWNPYECGGVALFGDAEAPFPGPLFLLTFFWLPTAAAMNVWMLVHLAFGAAGAAWLAREQGANRFEQWTVAAIVSGSSFLAHHFLWEHLSFAPFCLLPWILWAHRRSLTDRRWAVLTGALFALSVMEGGANPTPLMAVVVGLDSLLRLRDPVSRRGLMHAFPIAVSTALLLSAPRLIAIWSVLRHGRRSAAAGDGLSLADLLDSLTSLRPPDVQSHPFGWDEYSAYVGWLALALAILGGAASLLNRGRQTSPVRLDLFLLLLLLWLAMGDSPSVSLHRMFGFMPVYRDLRVPSRFLFPAVLSLALLAAAGLAYLREHVFLGRWFIAAEGAVLVLLVIDLAFADRDVFRSVHLPAGVVASVPVGEAPPTFFQTPGPGMPNSAGPVLGQGLVDCYHPQYPVTPAPGLQMGQVPQQWVEPASAGFAVLERWTPNEVVVSAQFEHEGRVVVNQNDDADWHISKGSRGAAQGLLAVNLPPGRHLLRLWHSPPAFAFGWLCFVVGLGWALFWWRRPTVALH